MNISFPVQVFDFPAGSPWFSLNGPRPQTFTWSAILRAAMVAGYPSLRSIPSRQFARWRTAALHMSLRRSGGTLVRPPEWKRLDPSEKGAISSLLGVVVTKLLVERLLNAPLFLFVDVYFTIIFPPGVAKVRPDFVAMTPATEWFSVEAKGKARFLQATLDNGKTQAKMLGTVNGSPIQARVVCVTSFRRGEMVARFADPPPSGSSLPTAKISMEEVLKSYYDGIFRFKQFSERLGQREVPGLKEEVTLWQSSDMDVQFGLLPDLEIAMDERSPERALAVLKKISHLSTSEQTPHLGPDGIIIIPGASWKSGHLES